jgi:hypothetical protein
MKLLLPVAVPSEKGVRLTLVLDKKTLKIEVAPHVAASLVREISQAMAEKIKKAD